MLDEKMINYLRKERRKLLSQYDKSYDAGLLERINLIDKIFEEEDLENSLQYYL